MRKNVFCVSSTQSYRSTGFFTHFASTVTWHGPFRLILKQLASSDETVVVVVLIDEVVVLEEDVLVVVGPTDVVVLLPETVVVVELLPPGTVVVPPRMVVVVELELVVGPGAMVVVELVEDELPLEEADVVTDEEGGAAPTMVLVDPWP